jgi:predicted nucleotidyltransferase
MKDISKKLVDFCRQYGIRDLYVFGSRAEEVLAMVRNFPGGYASTESGVDIGIFPDAETLWSPDKIVSLAIDLEDLFQASRVDIVFMPEADAFLCADIVAGELLYTADPNEQARYELFVLRRAGDLLPFKKVRTHMILEEGAR